MTTRLGPSAVAAAAISVLTVVGCSREVPPVVLSTVPSTLALREATSTTLGPDYSSTPLEPAASSIPPTPTIAFNVGVVTIFGTVQGPDGPVADANVRVERLVGDLVAAKDVRTDDEGRYRLENIEGGRVRIRAWRTPDLAALEPLVTFASGKFEATITVKRFDETSIQWSLSPAVPIAEQNANLVVQVSRQTVGDDGILRQVPVRGVGVGVTPRGLLQNEVVSEILTSERGRVQVPLRCFGVGGSELQVSLATGESATISPPSCQPPPTTSPPTAPPPVSSPTEGSAAAPVEAAVTVPATTVVPPTVAVVPNPVPPAASPPVPVVAPA